MKREVFFFGLILILSGIVASYNACGTAEPFNFMKTNGTIAPNPYSSKSSQDILTAICSVIDRCQPQLQPDICQNGVLTSSGIGARLGLPPNTEDPFSALESAENTGVILGNPTATNNCVNAISNLSCSDPNVQNAYSPTSSTPFAAVDFMVPVNSCGTVFTPPVQQFACTTKVFLVGQNSSNGPQVSGAGYTYSVSPALPAGLNLNSSTGVISGAATAVTPMTAYTVTATNSLSSSQSVVNLRTANGYLVNDLTDRHNAGPGCNTSSGTCTLRAAIEEVNTVPAINVILLPSGSNLLTLGPMNITEPMDIYGDCAQGTTIDGNNSSQIVTVAPAASGNISFNSMTFQNGLGTNVNGGAISIVNPGVATFTVALNSSVLQNNALTGNTGVGLGGAVYALGNGATQQVILNVNNSTFTNNKNTVAGGFGGGAIAFHTNSQGVINNSSFISNSSPSGGAFYHQGSSLIVTQSLFYNNSSTGGGGAITIGIPGGNQTFSNDSFISNAGNVAGAIYQGTTVNVTNCTFANNTAGANNGGAIYSGGAGTTYNLWNTLFENNTANGVLKHCFPGGTYTTHGFNLSDNVAADCNLNPAAGDIVGTKAKLGPIQNNGGLSETMALLPSSAGIDQAGTAACPSIDQRGFPRLTDGKCDIGAFESQP